MEGMTWPSLAGRGTPGGHRAHRCVPCAAPAGRCRRGRPARRAVRKTITPLDNSCSRDAIAPLHRPQSAALSPPIGGVLAAMTGHSCGLGEPSASDRGPSCVTTRPMWGPCCGLGHPTTQDRRMIATDSGSIRRYIASEWRLRVPFGRKQGALSRRCRLRSEAEGDLTTQICGVVEALSPPVTALRDAFAPPIGG